MTTAKTGANAVDWVVITAAVLCLAAIGLWVMQQRRGVQLLPPTTAAADAPPPPAAPVMKKARGTTKTAE